MSLISLVLIIGVCLLAYSNGSNDNFKGVATLFGSDTTNYRTALAWATIATFAGSVCSILIAESLAIHFSGKGLVPADVAGSMLFLQAVVFGAGLCVWVATLTGLPISTTHSLVGALVGAGFMAVGPELNVSKLGMVFVLPLLVSPLIALVLSGGVYGAFRKLRKLMGWEEETCVCVGETLESAVIEDSAMTAHAISTMGVYQASSEECDSQITAPIAGVKLRKAMTITHYLSAGGVCFARGLNDTPKIVAALLATKAAGLQHGLILVAVFMALGGIFQARKVAETMSKKITPINEGQGLSANMVTFVLVVFASRLGVPVSTTHVSVGSLFGIGLATGNADKRAVSGIVSAWVGTLPVAAALAAASYALLALLQ